MKRALAIILALTMVFMTFAFTGCGNDVPDYKEVKGGGDIDISSDVEENEDEEPTTYINPALEEIQSKGELVYAVSADFSPYAYMEGNEYLGIDIELMQAFASSIGVKLQIENVAFGSLVDYVYTGNADCAGSGLTITDERKEYVDFSDVYLVDRAVVIIRADEQNNNVYTSPDFKIAIVSGSQYQYYFDEDNLNYSEFITQEVAVLAMQNSQCDGCIVYEGFAKEFVKDNPDYKIATTYCDDSYAIAFQKDSPLIPVFNQFIKDYKASGEFDELLQKYDFM